MRRLIAVGLGVVVVGVGASLLLRRPPRPGPRPCQEFVSRCEDAKVLRGPLQELLFCAETLADLSDVDPDDAGDVCLALLEVLDRAPRDGWRKALLDAGFVRTSR